MSSLVSNKIYIFPCCSVKISNWYLLWFMRLAINVHIKFLVLKIFAAMIILKEREMERENIESSITDLRTHTHTHSIHTQFVLHNLVVLLMTELLRCFRCWISSHENVFSIHTKIDLLEIIISLHKWIYVCMCECVPMSFAFTSYYQ